MGLFSPILFFLLCFVYVEVKTKALIQESIPTGYYWDYPNGKILANALKAGVSHEGYPIYIGHIDFLQTTIVGPIIVVGPKMYFNTNNIQYSMDYTTGSATTFKILCARHPEQFKWISINNKEQFESLNKERLVEGGRNINYYKYYIGRTISEKGPFVAGLGVTVADNGKRELRFLDYGYVLDRTSVDVLSYDPQAPVIKTKNTDVVTTSNGNSSKQFATGNNLIYYTG